MQANKMFRVLLGGPLGGARTGTVDPSSGDGVAAPIGTFFVLDQGSGYARLYFKGGPADTDWSPVSTDLSA